MDQQPTYTPPPKEGKGPWGMLQARILLALAVPVLLLITGVYFLITHLFPEHRETRQQQQARQVAQQYDQTAPPNPAEVSAFKKRAEQTATDLAREQANAANLAKLLGQGTSPNAANANPLAVPGNPMNTDPRVYKAWVDADATARQATLAAPGGMNPQPTPGTASGSAENANTTAEQKREEARKREEERRLASMVVIDFTQQETKPEPETKQTPETAANAPQTPLVNTASSPAKTEPIPLQEHYCYELCEGDHLDTVLVNRLDGAAPGYVDVMVINPVFSHDWDPKGRRLLIPVGSRVLGDVFSVGSAQQQRLYVAFHKLRRPDGSTFPLDNLKGLDQAGEAGLRDKVNNHLLSKVATAGAIAALGTLTQVNNVGAYAGIGGYDWGVQMRNGVTSQIGQEGMQMFQQKLNQLPSMTAREGKVLVKVYISGDYSIHEYSPKMAGVMYAK